MVKAAQGMVASSQGGLSEFSWTGDVNGFECLHQDPRFAGLFGHLGGHLRQYLDGLSLNGDRLCL